MKTKLNCTEVIITLSGKQMENLEGFNLSIFVTKMFGHLSKKYPQYRWHGTWGMKDNKLTFFCEKKKPERRFQDDYSHLNAHF